MLKRVRKGAKATVSQSEKAAEAANRAGIAVDGHFILGYPGETVQTMQKTIDLACSLPLTFAHFYAAVPFPGSTLYEEAIENGWIGSDEYACFSQDRASINTDTLDTGTIDRYIHRAYRAFYLSPGTMLRILKIPRSLREFAELIRMGSSFYNILIKS
jgi:anaerobic magnesium-protoporphyrin IX monomethyl ester cyclase